MRRVIEYKGSKIECEVASDSWKYDTVVVDDGDSQLQWFVTRQNKTYELANFEGDQSLVPEQRLFEVLAAVARIYQGEDAPLIADAKNVFETAYFEFQIQQVISERDNLFRLMGGGDIFSVGGLGVSFMGDGAWPNVRKFAVSRIVPGGRSIEWTIYWPGGITIAAKGGVKLQIALYGLELIPKGKI
jgi:hypothetical protein